jgi:hypothetical protein
MVYMGMKKWQDDATRYLVAAIFMSGVASWDATMFEAGLEYVGSPLLK